MFPAIIYPSFDAQAGAYLLGQAAAHTALHHSLSRQLLRQKRRNRVYDFIHIFGAVLGVRRAALRQVGQKHTIGVLVDLDAGQQHRLGGSRRRLERCAAIVMRLRLRCR